MGEYNKPLPLITERSKIFYDGCSNGRLLYLQCSECGEVVFFPKALCSNCMGTSLEWKESSGKGKIYSFTVTREFAPPDFAKATPYVLAIVNMNDGFSVMSNIVDCDFDELSCDMPVSVKFEKASPEISLPKFVPIRE